MTTAIDGAVFDRIVSGIYGAATGAHSWNQALDGVQAAFGARAALLHTLDLGTGRLLSLHHGGPNLDEAVLNYVREYHLIDPRRNHVIARGEQGMGQWVHDHEVFGDDFVAGDPYCQHFLPAYSARFHANVMLPVADGVATGLALELHADRGPLDADERAFARRLGEHMREALRLHEKLRRMAAQALAGHGLLQNFGCPMWLLDEQRCVHHANPAAHAEHNAETRTALRAERLVLRNDTADQLLTERLHTLGRAGHGVSAVINLRCTASDPPTWLHLQAMQPSAVLGAFGDRPLMLLTLFDPAQTPALDPLALSGMFGLTPTEARVAALLAEGLTAKEIARRLRCAPATVRSHQRQILAKLGVPRTVDVVRLLRQGEALWAQAGGLATDGLRR